MATLKFKRKTTTGDPSTLAVGEPAVNTNDNKFFIGVNSSVVKWVGAEIENSSTNGTTWSSDVKLATKKAIGDYFVPLSGGTITGNLTFNSTSGTVYTPGSGTGNVTIKGPGTGNGTGFTIKLPPADGTANQVLKTDGSGQLGWATASGGGTPSAPTGSLQYNNSGSFGGAKSTISSVDYKTIGIGKPSSDSSSYFDGALSFSDDGNGGGLIRSTFITAPRSNHPQPGGLSVIYRQDREYVWVLPRQPNTDGVGTTSYLGIDRIDSTTIPNTSILFLKWKDPINGFTGGSPSTTAKIVATQLPYKGYLGGGDLVSTPSKGTGAYGGYVGNIFFASDPTAVDNTNSSDSLPDVVLTTDNNFYFDGSSDTLYCSNLELSSPGILSANTGTIDTFTCDTIDANISGTIPTIYSNTINADTIYLSSLGSTIVFEGSTNDPYQTTLGVVNPTADRTINLPNVSGTIITSGNLTDITSVGTISSGTWSGSTIATTKGGTGLTSYATGDILYASASNTLSVLTKPASSTSLLQMTSAGSPSWLAMASNIATFLGTPSSANLAAAITDETGSGSLVFGTSPSFTTSITTGSSSFDVFNSTATTINAFGAAATLVIGATSGMASIRNATLKIGNTFGTLISSNGLLTIYAGNNVGPVFSGTRATIDIENSHGTGLIKLSGGDVGLYSKVDDTFGENESAVALRFYGIFGNYIGLVGAGATEDRTITLPDATGTVALTANKLSVFAATTSSELAGVISDETGSGALVFATSPTLVTPNLGAATASSININSYIQFSDGSQQVTKTPDYLLFDMGIV